MYFMFGTSSSHSSILMLQNIFWLHGVEKTRAFDEAAVFLTKGGRELNQVSLYAHNKKDCAAL